MLKESQPGREFSAPYKVGIFRLIQRGFSLFLNENIC